MMKMLWSVIPKYITEHVLLKKLNFLRVKNSKKQKNSLKRKRGF